MKRGIFLTPRDLKLLQDLYVKSVMSFAQIAELHFTGLAKQTIANRLNRLVRANLIHKHRAGIIIHAKKPIVVEMVYTVARAGQKILSDRYRELQVRDIPTVLNTFTLVHDLMLSDLVEGLRREFKGYHVRNGKHFQNGTVSTDRVPDLILEDSSGHERIAVELELTQKSDKRMREILLSYRIDKTFKRVLYFATDQRILQKIYHELTGFDAESMDFSNLVVAENFELRLLQATENPQPENLWPIKEGGIAA